MNRSLALSLAVIVVLCVVIVMVAAYHVVNDHERAAWRTAHHCKLMPRTIEESPQTRYACDGGEVVTQ